jgi:hypothetical protein
MTQLCATFLNPTNPHVRRTQSARIAKNRAIEAVATVFWAMATLIATTVAAFA